MQHINVLFDHDGKVSDWWSGAPHGDFKHAYRSPHCWVCSLVGEANARSLNGHRQCLARSDYSDGITELWIIHSDHQRNTGLTELNNVKVRYAPAAILFVSFDGGKDFFAGRTAEVLTVQLSATSTVRSIPVFYHRGGLHHYSTYSNFQNLLTVFEVALQEAEGKQDGDPLAPFRKAASDIKAGSIWPQTIGLQDNPDALFLLWVALTQGLTGIVQKLFDKGDLSIAVLHKDKLQEYLWQLHGGFFVSLSCRAIVAEELHKQFYQRPRLEGEREKEIKDLKSKTVKEWFAHQVEIAEHPDLKMALLRTEEIALGDVERWSVGA